MMLAIFIALLNARLCGHAYIIISNPYNSLEVLLIILIYSLSKPRL